VLSFGRVLSDRSAAHDRAAATKEERLCLEI
jgi:hypothetical protein